MEKDKAYIHNYGSYAYGTPSYSQLARRLFKDLLLNGWTDKDCCDFLNCSYRCDIVRYRVAKMFKRKFKKSVDKH